MASKRRSPRGLVTSKLSNWEQEATLPGWWKALTLGGLALLGAALVITAVNDAGDVATPVPNFYASNSSPDGVAPLTETETPAVTTAVPTVVDLTATPTSGGGVPVALLSGGEVDVPSAAADMALTSMRGTYDPAAASQVLLATGGDQHSPAEASAGSVSKLTLLSPLTDALNSRVLLFSAVVDIDGKAGPVDPTNTTRSVALIDGVWVLNR